MATAQEGIVELVDMLAHELTDEPDVVEVKSTEVDGALSIEIAVSEGDVGKVIGRQGRVIKAIRTIARAAAAQEDFSVDVEVLG
jgi:predicted RNA-binding protein YlqC (UPF0109 family)